MKVVEILSASGTVSVQWIAPEVGIVRYHGSGRFGSPFSFCVTMVKDDGVATFYAAMDKYSRMIHRAMRDAMWAIGISKVCYERRTPRLRQVELVR